MRMLLGAFFLAFFSSGATAQTGGDHWYIGLSSTSEDGASITFVDVNRIQINGNIRRAWVEGHSTGTARSDRGIRQMRNLNEYDCVQRKQRNIQLTAYFVDPTQAPYTTEGDRQWSFVVPDTAGEWTLDFVCASDASRMTSERYVRIENGMTTEEAAALLFDIWQRNRER